MQVESLAQMGVQLLLFALGLEFSLSKLRAVRAVALLGKHLLFLIQPSVSNSALKSGLFFAMERCRL